MYIYNPVTNIKTVECEQACSNGGKCVPDGHGGTKCLCPEGYIGTQCEQSKLILQKVYIMN